MANITLDELEKELRPKETYEIGHTEFNSVKVDSRDIQEGDIFIALVGKNHDAHKFIPQAFDRGAHLAVVEKKVEYPCIVVDNTFEALKKTAGYIFKKSKAYSIAVTGSSGKTTTKELIYSILSDKSCHKTKENENNFIGVSKTLLSIGKSKLCIVEVGTNHRGEMANIASFFSPDIAVFTNIGKTHIENFGSMKNILQEKISIIADKTEVVYNYDDLYLRSAFKGRGVSCSLRNTQTDVYIDKIHKDKIIFSLFDKKISMNANLTNSINIYDILLSIAAVYMYDSVILANNIDTMFQNFKMPSLRMQEEKISSTIFILDCYNANPDSMKYALSNLNQKNGKNLAILGDMLELGNFSTKFHEDLGELLSSLDMDIITFGKSAYHIHEKAKINNRNSTWFFKDKNELIEFLSDIYVKYDNILIKGSRGMKMEEIFYQLKGDF